MQMPWETIFEVTNIYAMVCWLILLLAPKREQVLPMLFMAGCGLLAATYTVLIVGLMSGTLDAAGPRSQDFSSLAGVMGLFDSKGGATIGWIHYLAFDLFVGIWAARNADRRGIAPLDADPGSAVHLPAWPIRAGSLSGLAHICRKKR
jgi:hypothetical protein